MVCAASRRSIRAADCEGPGCFSQGRRSESALFSMLKPEHTERILSITALLTAVVAVLLGVIESQRSHEHRKLSVEPHVLIGNAFHADGMYQLLLQNNGLGPARVGTIEVHVDGKRMTNWESVVNAVTETEAKSIAHSTLVTDLMIPAGEAIYPMQIVDKTIGDQFFQNRSKHRIEIELCYCSVYRDCWVSRYHDLPLREPVASCGTGELVIFPDNG